MLTNLKNKLQNKFKGDPHFAELVRGSGTAFVLKILGIISGYIFTLIVTRIFSAETWGIFALCFTVLQITSVIGRLGLDTALLRFVAEYSTQGKWNLVREIYLKTLKLTVPFSLTLSLILFFISPFIAKYLFHKKYLESYFRIISVALVPFVLLFINSESLRGIKKIKEYTFFQNVGIMLFASITLIILFFLHKKDDLPILAYTSSVFIIFLASLFLWLKILKSKIQHPKFSTFVSCKTSTISYKYLLSVSIPMLLSSSLFFIMQWTDTIMLGIFRTEKEVGIYNVALKLAALTSITLFAINTIAAPKFAEFWGKGDIKGLKRVAQQSTKLIFWTSLPMLLSLWLFPSYILSIFGSEFKIGVTALIMLTLGQFINAISGSVGYILQMTGKQKVFQNIILTASIINIILNASLIPRFGMNGAAFASLISLAVINVIPFFLVKYYYGFYTFTLNSVLFKGD